MASVQVDSFDRTALVASGSLASDHVRLIETGEKDEEPILARKKSTGWKSIVDALGFTINTHTLRISIAKERVDAIRDTLEDDWPRSKQFARAQDVLSVWQAIVEPNIRGKRRYIFCLAALASD